jgi:hypothetical protein
MLLKLSILITVEYDLYYWKDIKFNKFETVLIQKESAYRQIITIYNW